MHRLLGAACGALSASALFAIMALTFFDVGARKLLAHSIPGSFELTELLMVALIFGSLPLVSHHEEHVVFDSLDGLLPPALRRLQSHLVHLLCASAMLGLAWLMWGSAGQFLESGETTAQLKVAKAPFLYGMSLLCAIAGLAHLGLLAGRSPAAEQAQASEGTVL